MLFKANVKPMLAMDTFERCKIHTRKNKGAEIEFRLGKKTMKMFDTNIGHDLFTKITTSLDKYTEWESVKKTDESVYYKGDYRIIIDNDTENTIHQTKTKVYIEDFKLPGKLDFRFAVSKEESCENKGCEMDREVHRTRTSYIRKGVQIDCTVVEGAPTDKDSETTKAYQVEVELISVPTQDHELYNSMHKVMNLLSVLDQ